MWHDMFVIGVPVLERVLRAAFIYVIVVVVLRVAGKRELGQLNSLDLVVLLFLSNILQNAIIGNDLSITGGVIGAVTLMGINYITNQLLFRFRRLDELIEGEPTVLVQEGKLLADNMRRELITGEELLVACHKQGILRLEDVDRAYLEPGGAITVFARTPTSGEAEAERTEQKLDDVIAALRRLELRLSAQPGG